MQQFKRKYYHFIFAALLTIALAACKNDPEPEPEQFGSLALAFHHVVNNQPLVLQNTSYTNANGDAFTVSMFKYYISNIKLKRADGTEYVQPESYYLIDEAKPASKAITLDQIPAGEYTGLSFILGVDSTRNVSGAQTGALDPLHGMFWTWNSGYIFLKLEGTSPQSADGNLTYHIGGFRSPNNTIRRISPDLGNAKINISTAGKPHLVLKADVADMFKGPNLIRFSELSASMGGPTAVQIANNYTDMIKLDQLHQ